ncbi:hypothetical protein [Marinicella sp. W31]|uniref:hypothetical protein n=1 Tax=Marinicella sp. W31 TaxID=3023713 RepID=UPI003757B6F1
MNSSDSKNSVSWRPLKRGGTSWRTHKIKQQAEILKVIPTKSEQLIGWIILLVALAALFGLVPYLFSHEKTTLAIFTLIAAPLFGLMGYAMAKSVKTLTFDLFQGVYFQGKQQDPIEASLNQPPKKPFFRMTEYGDDTDIRQQAHGRLRDIVALQIIEETISNRRHGTHGVGNRNRQFTSYELNLVLQDGKRLNVMDHGSWTKFEEDCEQISQFLQLPIWRADAP